MYVLLRHAEKRDGPDPGLTPEGKKRADLIAKMFGENDNISIFSTSYERTRQTAQPLSFVTGQPITEYQKNEISAFVDSLSSVRGLKCIIGHSTSTIELVEALTGIAENPINESTEFDRMYVFKTPLNSPEELIRMRFGGTC